MPHHPVPQEKEGVNAKILKDVKFPMLLDVYELCSEELQQKLLPMRTHFKAWEDLKAEEARVPANKTGDKATEKKELPCVPYSFDDGEGVVEEGVKLGMICPVVEILRL